MSPLFEWQRPWRWLPRVGTLVSSVLIVAAFPPWDLSFLAWFCLVPWLISLSRCKTKRAAFVQGVWMSFGMSVLGFHWVATVLHEFGMLPWALSILGLCLYSLAGQPQFLIFGPVYLFSRRIAQRRDRVATRFHGLALFALLVSLGLFYAGLDAVLPKLFKDTLGHALYSAPWLRQAADLGGAPLLTFLLISVNLALAELACRGRRGLPRALRACAPPLAFCLALTTALTVYGALRSAQVERWMGHPSWVAHAGLIQANIGDFDKIASERGIHGASEQVLSEYFRLSDEALSLQPRPDFLVWPETAYPSTFRKPFTIDDYNDDRQVEQFVRDRKVPLLFGGYDRDHGKDFNTLFLLAPSPLSPQLLDPIHSSGNDLEYYRKNILLMFGEYIPFQDEIPFLSRQFPQVGDFGRGIGPDVLSVPIYDGRSTLNPLAPSRVLKVSPLICYEVLFPDYVIAAANRGSQLILNITNDSWFGPNGEPYLHLALSVFRTIETRLPLVRSTNTGFTALVLPTGEIAKRTRLFEPEILGADIPILPPLPTLMKLWGNWFGKTAFFLGIFALTGIWALEKRARRSTAV